MRACVVRVFPIRNFHSMLFISFTFRLEHDMSYPLPKREKQEKLHTTKYYLCIACMAKCYLFSYECSGGAATRLHTRHVVCVFLLRLLSFR